MQPVNLFNLGYIKQPVPSPDGMWKEIPVISLEEAEDVLRLWLV